jgi:hypothetical protein
MNPKVTALATKRGEQVGISAERLSTLDADARSSPTARSRRRCTS